MKGCSEECNKHEGCCSFEYSHSSGLCNLNRDCQPSKEKYLDYNFCTRNCPANYVSAEGDIPGWGQIKGRIQTTMKGCSEECNKHEGCCSFEYSHSSGLCNLNRDCQPSKGKYLDYNFCIRKCGTVNVDCQTGNGAAYHGETSHTVSGLKCQAWNVQTPHRHGFRKLGNHNQCRNPDGTPGVWCYTTNPRKRWELCDVPKCSDCDKEDVATQNAVLIVGGWDNPGNAEVFFPETGKGCRVPHYSFPDTLHSTTMDSFGDGTLVCGGSPKSKCFKFSPSGSPLVWTKYSNLNIIRYEHTSWASKQGVVLIGGYEPFGKNSETTAELNGRVLPFKLPPNRDACAIPQNDDDSVIVTGGRFTKTKVSRYNLKGLVEELPTLNHGRSTHGCGSYVTFNKKVLIVAGGDNAGGETTEKFVIGDDAWTSVGNLPRRTRWISGATVSMNNKIYIFGGEEGGNRALNDILEYDDVNDAWKSFGALSSGRYRHAAAAINADELTLCGGCCESLNVEGKYGHGEYKKTSEKHNGRPIYKHTGNRSPGWCIFFGGHWKIDTCDFLDKANGDWSQGYGWSNVNAMCPGNIGPQWRYYSWSGGSGSGLVDVSIKVECM